jgi:hypothetical protein
MPQWYLVVTDRRKGKYENEEAENEGAIHCFTH